VFRIVDRRYWFFLLSALVLLPGLISLVVNGLPRAIDFTGGAFWEVEFESADALTEAGLREVYADLGLGVAQVVMVEGEGAETGGRRVQMRSIDIEPAEKEALAEALAERFGAFTELRFDSVGPAVGQEVTRKAAMAVAMAAIGIMIYLTIQFRNVPHPVRYGVCAIVALVHDVIAVVGLASLVGYFRGWEVDALFLTAVLTVIGFSVHDSIVVFDRIRENVTRMRGLKFERIVNHSIMQTLNRSINTQLTALFALAAVFTYSDGQLERFTFWLMIGLISGTYSSLFNAAPLLVVWENREWRRWFGRGGKSPAAA